MRQKPSPKLILVWRQPRILPPLSLSHGPNSTVLAQPPAALKHPYLPEDLFLPDLHKPFTFIFLPCVFWSSAIVTTSWLVFVTSVLTTTGHLCSKDLALR